MKEESFLKRRKETTESAVKSSFGRARNELNFFDNEKENNTRRGRRKKSRFGKID